ncbi:HRDC domain-containing protein [Desulfococcaceae bacterium HSG8]|nr:HRDC domain-containing protein [Desulfococcaceae bacterium HSG8]
MPVHIITIPFDPDKKIFEDEELNRFLLNKRVKNMRYEFFRVDGHPYWTVLIDYEIPISKHVGKEDDSLNDVQKRLYRKLREWRKEISDKEGIPLFIIANNSHLVDVALSAPATLEALRQISGFGKKKIDKYGEDIIKIILIITDLGMVFFVPEGQEKSGNRWTQA